MRDNLIFYNIKELKNENVTDVIHNVLENQLELENAKSLVKIDRAHRLGKQDPRSARPRAIVCKLNYYPDKERILANTRKSKGSGIAISEQFPEEILKVRKRLYPILKKQNKKKSELKWLGTSYLSKVNFMLNLIRNEYWHQISNTVCDVS